MRCYAAGVNISIRLLMMTIERKKKRNTTALPQRSSTFATPTRLKRLSKKLVTVSGLSVCAPSDPYGSRHQTMYSWTDNVNTVERDLKASSGKGKDKHEVSASGKKGHKRSAEEHHSENDTVSLYLRGSPIEGGRPSSTPWSRG